MGGVAIVLFSDLVDSTALLASLGDDRMEEVRRAHVRDVADAVEAAGGRLVKTLGDGAMASFESALGALRAAAAIQAAVERLDAERGGIGIAARVGVAAGEPIADGEDLHGMAVVIASRLSSAAGSGEVLIQDVVRALVASRDGVVLEEASEYELKGVPAPVRAARLRWREMAVVGPTPGGERVNGPPPDATTADLPMPRLLAAYAEEPLIGRDREIEALREATAPRPGRRAVLILGEPGIGKTRHAAAAATEAHAGGALVVLARCPPEAVVPFEPWVRAIGELARAGDDAWRASLGEAAGPELSALVPELSGQAAQVEQGRTGEAVAAEGARYRLLQGVGAALSRAAGEAPLQVVLDDAHWCDPASAQALAHLLDSAPTPRLVVVVTARDRELGRRHPVSRVLSDLRRTGDLGELRLTGLDPSGLAALVGARTGRAITPRLAERLRSRTAGNPFFAGELVRDLDDQGVLRDEGALEEAPVPDAVTGLVEERLGRLDADTERLLRAVAAIGPVAEVDLAARAAGLSAEEAERAVREALSERLVDDVAAAEATVAFPHALVREALIAAAGDADLARLHLAIARALEEDPEAEPADLARHYGLSVELAGPEPAVVAYRAAAAAAAAGHDHEQAAAHLRSMLGLLPGGDDAARTSALLELGEQELLSADLVRASGSFLEAIEMARRSGDGAALARAALGFAGGDIGFGWEIDTGDRTAVELLQEGLEALGEDEPRLALRMIFRLTYLQAFTEDDEVMPALVERAAALDRRLGDAESEVLARFTRLAARFARSADPMSAYSQIGEILELVEIAERCGREELLFRTVLWAAVVHYALRRIPECDAAIERAGEIAERLGSPRFSWEVDVNRGSRLVDRGDRAAGEALVRRAGMVLGRLRPDLHMSIELTFLTAAGLMFDAETESSRTVYEAVSAGVSQGYLLAALVFGTALDGDHEAAREGLTSVLGADLAMIRRPDAHLPASLSLLALTATIVGDRVSGEQLRRLLEPLRPYLIQAPPSLFFGSLPAWCIGRLELLAGRPEAAVEELREAVKRADELELAMVRSWARVDLARALHHRGSAEEARAALAEGEEFAARYGFGLISRLAREARAELEGRELPARAAPTKRSRPIRALTTRGTRRALSTMVGGLSDADLERRFADPRRQRALVRGMARGFQPARAGGFNGTIAYELEPFAIDPPLDSPWRWAIEVDSRAGRARLIEPAPLDAAVTVHFGLADWVRVLAGVENPLAAMVAGRCRVEGDVMAAARLEAMFGAGDPDEGARGLYRRHG